MIFLKAIITAFVVVLLSELAKRFSVISGILAAMPLTTLLVLLWVYVDTKDRNLILRFSEAVLYALVPTAVFFLVFIFLMKRDYSFLSSLLIAFLGWGLLAFFVFRLLGN